MHEALVAEIVRKVRIRADQGDCPTVAAPSRELMEGAILELSDAVANLGRICEAVRFTAGLGKGQMERVTHAQSLIAPRSDKNG